MQTAVSHCSAESEIMSIDASLRIHGLPALLFLFFVLETMTDAPARGNCVHQRFWKTMWQSLKAELTLKIHSKSR